MSVVEQMGVIRFSDHDYTVVIGPCPGCENWQLDYTYEAAGQFAVFEVEEIYELHSEEPVDTSIRPDVSAFYAVVEDLLGEHLDECPHLQRLLAEDVKLWLA